MEEVDKEDVGALQTTKTSLEKALINVVDYLTIEEEKDLRTFLEDLDHEENIPARGTSFEELKSGSPPNCFHVSLEDLYQPILFLCC